MKMIDVLSIIDEIEKALGKFRDWIVENYSNPILWIGLFLFGLFVFQMTFSALQKEK